MKKIGFISILISLAIIFTLSENAIATGGGLRKATIKTCPDGITYGLHSDGNGGTHWHHAATNGENYYAVDEAINYDPCPGNSGNQGTAVPTNGGSNSTSNNYAPYPVNYDSAPNNYVPSPVNYDVAPAEGNHVAPSAEEIAAMSNDASLSQVKVDGVSVEISDVMTTHVAKRDVALDIVASDSKATVSYENRSLALKDNKFDILVTAEDGSTKNYELNIIRDEKEGTVSIRKITVNNSSTTAPSSTITEYISQDASSADVDIELSGEGKIEIFQGDNLIEKFDNLSDRNEYLIVISDNDGNMKKYNLILEKESTEYFLIGLFFTLLFLGGCIAVVAVPIVIIINMKKKK